MKDLEAVNRLSPARIFPNDHFPTALLMRHEWFDQVRDQNGRIPFQLNVETNWTGKREKKDCLDEYSLNFYDSIIGSLKS